LRETILAFRDDEIGHRDVAIAHGAKETPGYDLISGAVRAGSRIAIWLSTRF
jgi:3-demethoxyubiquinol 3-hydroxylase